MFRLTAQKDNVVVKEFGDFENRSAAWRKIEEVDGDDPMENPQWPEDTIPVVTCLETGERLTIECDAWVELPKITGVAPKIIVMRQHYFGKGDTVTEAWNNLRKISGYTMTQLKKEPWVMYFGHDTDQVPFTINEMGSICYHSDYPYTEIDNNLPEK